MKDTVPPVPPPGSGDWMMKYFSDFEKVFDQLESPGYWAARAKLSTRLAGEKKENPKKIRKKKGDKITPKENEVLPHEEC
jgi:hypothetical protein